MAGKREITRSIPARGKSLLRQTTRAVNTAYGGQHSNRSGGSSEANNISGLGFGIISCAFSFVNILREMKGPGTIGIQGDSQYFFLISAFMSSAFVMLHIFWGVVFCSALDSQKAWKKALGVCLVVVSHLIVSSVTLLNQQSPPVYSATLTVTYVNVLLMGVWAFASAGGTARSLIKFFNPCLQPATVTRTNQD